LRDVFDDRDYWARGVGAEFVESLADAVRQLRVTASTISRAFQRRGEVGSSPREGKVNIVKDVP